MKKLLQFILFMAFVGTAYADELSDASRFFANKEFSKAMQIYSRLAQNGNVEAQELLGEMYWYGDGTPPDLKNAESWFRKASIGGQKKAQQFVQIIDERFKRASQITYYTDLYDGHELKLSNFGCRRPDIPLVSNTNEEIKQVETGVKQWLDCYNKFVDSMDATLPIEKNIPKDLERIMSEDELAKAIALMNKKYSEIASEAKSQSSDLLKKQNDWRLATEQFIAANNEKNKRVNEMMKDDLDRAQRQLYEAKVGALIKAPVQQTTNQNR